MPGGLQLVGAMLVGTVSGAVSPGPASPGPPSARPPPPTPAQQRAIVAAVHHSPLLAAVPPTGYAVTKEAVSHRDGTYAFATVVPTGPWADPARVELRRRDGHWVATEIGTARVGCRAPRAVRAEMGIVCR